MDPWQARPHLLLGFQHPIELVLPVFVLAGPECVRYALQSVHEGAGTVVGWVHLHSSYSFGTWFRIGYNCMAGWGFGGGYACMPLGAGTPAWRLGFRDLGTAAWQVKLRIGITCIPMLCECCYL